MISIELRDIELYASHGIYEGEELTGNPYLIHVDVKYDETARDVTDINNTIDYTVLYEIIKQRMMIPTGLLEEVCESIIRRIKHKFPFVDEISLSIYKLQAPIPNLHGRVGVTMTKRFND